MEETIEIEVKEKKKEVKKRSIIPLTSYIERYINNGIHLSIPIEESGFIAVYQEKILYKSWFFGLFKEFRRGFILESGDKIFINPDHKPVELGNGVFMVSAWGFSPSHYFHGNIPLIYNKEKGHLKECYEISCINRCEGFLYFRKRSDFQQVIDLVKSKNIKDCEELYYDLVNQEITKNIL